MYIDMLSLTAELSEPSLGRTDMAPSHVMARNPIQSAADVRAQDVFRFPYKYWQEKGRIDF